MKFEANTKTLFKVLSTSDTITDITKGNTYDIYSDVDNEWHIIDDKGDKRYTFFVDNDIKEFYYDDFDYKDVDELSVNNNTSNIDGFLVHEIQETIVGIKRQLDLLEIFVNNFSIEPINPDVDYEDDEECCDDYSDLWVEV